MTIKEIKENFCGDSLIETIFPNPLKRPIISIIHCSDNDIECFYIPFIDEPDIEEEGIYGYYISIYEPKYVIETKNKMNKDLKERLMDTLINYNGWKELTKSFSIACDTEGGEYFNYCKLCRRHNRQFPATPPNYLLLPE